MTRSIYRAMKTEHGLSCPPIIMITWLPGQGRQVTPLTLWSWLRRLIIGRRIFALIECRQTIDDPVGLMTYYDWQHFLLELVMIVLALWNLRLGRLDRLSIVRSVVLVVIFRPRAGFSRPIIMWALRDTPSCRTVPSRFSTRDALSSGIPLEPPVRRLWPESLTWARISRGRFDAHVGREFLSVPWLESPCIQSRLDSRYHRRRPLRLRTYGNVTPNTERIRRTIGCSDANHIAGIWVGCVSVVYLALPKAALRQKWLAICALTPQHYWLSSAAHGRRRFGLSFLCGRCWQCVAAIWIFIQGLDFCRLS